MTTCLCCSEDLPEVGESSEYDIFFIKLLAGWAVISSGIAVFNYYVRKKG